MLYEPEAIGSMACAPVGERQKKIKMLSYIKKHAPNLQTILLILMIADPFGLYYFARTGSGVGVILFLVILGVVMLAAMKK